MEFSPGPSKPWSSPLSTLPISLFYRMEANLSPSNVLSPLSNLYFSLSDQSESVLCLPSLYFLIPIGWMFCSVWSSVVAGVALRVIGVWLVFHSPPLVVSGEIRQCWCDEIAALPATLCHLEQLLLLLEQLVSIREHLVSIEEQLMSTLCRACNLAAFIHCSTGLVVHPFASCHEWPRFKPQGDTYVKPRMSC